MKNRVVLLCGLLLLSALGSTLLAQRQENRRMDMADYEKRKREYIQKEAGLTQAEADKYFPLNNELTQKKFELHKERREKLREIKENSDISDEEYRKLLENDVEIKVKEAALDKEYAPKFEKVLSAEKLFKAQQAERDFMQKELNNFRQGGVRQGLGSRSYWKIGAVFHSHEYMDSPKKSFHSIVSMAFNNSSDVLSDKFLPYKFLLQKLYIPV